MKKHLSLKYGRDVFLWNAKFKIKNAKFRNWVAIIKLSYGGAKLIILHKPKIEVNSEENTAKLVVFY